MGVTRAVLFDDRTLERECFVAGATQYHEGLKLHAFARLSDWQESDVGTDHAIAIFAVGRSSLKEGDLSERLKAIVDAFHPTPVVVMGGREDTDEFSMAIDLGARGYVPVSIGLESILVAARVIASLGGAFLPGHVLKSVVKPLDGSAKASDEKADGAQETSEIRSMLTSRQLAVAQKLRQGMANKLIAYELGMCESTVKVHVREIMKRMRATNRTEAAVILNDALSKSDQRLRG